jgi:hypothetical protein
MSLQGGGNMDKYKNDDFLFSGLEDFLARHLTHFLLVLGIVLLIVSFWADVSRTVPLVTQHLSSDHAIERRTVLDLALLRSVLFILGILSLLWALILYAPQILRTAWKELRTRLPAKLVFWMNWTTAAIIAALGSKITLAVLILQRGFIVTSWDEFAKMVTSYKWAHNPYRIVHLWLPLQFYVHGLALKVWHDLLWTPRSVTLILSLVTFVTLYHLAKTLFDRTTAAISVIWLAVMPWPTWLSLTPLIEMQYITFLVLFFWFWIKWLETRRFWDLLIASFVLLLVTASNHPGWNFAVIYSGYLGLQIVKAILRRETTRHSLICQIVAALIPWVFPIYWLWENFRVFGDPMYFAHLFKESFVATGPPLTATTALSYYPVTLIKEYPLVCIFILMGMWAWTREQRLGNVSFYISVVIIALGMMTVNVGVVQSLSRNRPVRYLVPFIVLLIPYAAFAISRLLSKGLVGQIIGMGLLTPILLLNVIQTTHFPQIDSDVTDTGLLLRNMLEDKDIEEAERVLVEAANWEFFGIQALSNHPQYFVLDRDVGMLKRDTLSILMETQPEVETFLTQNDIRWLVLWDPQLKTRATKIMQVEAIAEKGKYTIYRIE